MKIVDAEVDIVSVPLTEHMVASFGEVTHATSAVVKLYSSDGQMGVGEAAPIYLFLTEGYEIQPIIMKKYLFPAIKGLEIFDIERGHQLMDQTIKGNHFAKGAINIAMYDLMGKTTGLPVYRLIGGKLRDRIPLIWSIGSCSAEETVRVGANAIKQGITTFMIKTGALDPAVDIQRVKFFREELGEEVKIIVDANGGWSPSIAIQTINAMTPYNLLFVEQPVPYWDASGLARVARHVTVPLSADESLSTPYSAFNLVALDAADVFSIKIAKHGGLYHAKTIAVLAGYTGRSCFINSMIETDLGVASSLQFAVSTSNLINSGHALMSGLRIEESILKEPLDYRDGYIYVSDKPGIGVELDEAKIEKYRIPSP